MMIRIGNFLFQHRNWVFPIVTALVFINPPPLLDNWKLAVGLGFGIALLGQAIRAVTIGLAYIKRGGKNKQVYAKTLVQEGMFAHCRNPLYVGNLLMLLGLGFIANSFWFIVVGMPIFLFFYLCIVAAEEQFLRNKFGPEYDDYCRRVPRWIPNLRGIGQTLHGMEFRWRRLIVKEHNSTYIWLLAAMAVLLQDRWARTHGEYEHGMTVLLVVMVLATLGYATVRYLKKSKVLVAD